jgi:hypothetical protein
VNPSAELLRGTASEESALLPQLTDFRGCVDSLVQTSSPRQPASVLTQEKIDHKLQKLALLFQAAPNVDERVKYPDLAAIVSQKAVQGFLGGLLQRTLNRIEQFQEYLQVEYVSLFNLLERLELSVWKIGKRPIGSFFWENRNPAAIVEHIQSFARSYKEAYLLRDMGLVALPLTVVTSTSVQPGVAVPVRDARAAWVVSTEAVAHETIAVPGRSSSGR